MRVIAVVPARDEGEHVARVVRTMPPSIERILVIDDGSVDDTGSIAASADPRVEVLRNPTSCGVGAAIARGYVRARALDADVAVVLAGDAQMDPADLPALIAPIAREEADYVKGDRLAWPGGAEAFPLPRLVGVIVLSVLTRLATGLPVHDSQCGYTAISRRALAAIDWSLLWPRFGYPNDLLVRLAELGLRVREVPVRPIYAGERSHLRAWHVPAIVALLARAMASRARGGRASAWRR